MVFLTGFPAKRKDFSFQPVDTPPEVGHLEQRCPGLDPGPQPPADVFTAVLQKWGGRGAREIARDRVLVVLLTKLVL